MTVSPDLPTPRPAMTVQGPFPYERLGITDAHNHLWIEPVPGAEPGGLVLNQFDTEKDALAEKACTYFMDLGLSPDQLVLCHMDKRPDAGLHKELARLGVLLEYDTFYRLKYNPFENLWSLIEKMASAGLSDRVALATDMAESELYHFIGGGAGLASLPGEIRDQLIKKGIPETARKQMLGGNIARRLAGIH